MGAGPATSVVIFGGTFDPVHFGHLRAAEEIREILAMDRFHLLPCGQPPHREAPLASPAQRVEMLRLAVGTSDGFTIDTREVDRPGPSFMADTLQSIRAAFPDSPLALVVGQDAANSLHRWHRWRELPHLAHLVVMSRHGDTKAYAPEVESVLEKSRATDPKELLRNRDGKFFEIAIDSLAVSASGIRDMIRSGRSPRFLLPDPVLNYIHRNGLYLG